MVQPECEKKAEKSRLKKPMVCWIRIGRDHLQQKHVGKDQNNGNVEMMVIFQRFPLKNCA